MSIDVGDLVARAIGDWKRPVVLIDGRSGSGKTTLARILAPALGAQLVRLDDFYTGWDGLEAGSTMVVLDVLQPRNPGWHRWDWTHDSAGEWHPIDKDLPLVVEGCGTLSRAAAPQATLRVWVELDDAERKRRALARDGSGYAPYWDRWAAQEDEFIARENPRALADIVVDGRELPIVDLAG